jgi:hypothetical protein
MKKVLIFIRQYSINKAFGNEFELSLPNKANLIDVIDEMDKILSSKGKFPSEDYHSLLHWIFNPVEERFYKQVSVIAYTKPGEFLNVRKYPKKELPEGVIIHITPDGPCISEAEEVIGYDIFRKVILKIHRTKQV